MEEEEELDPRVQVSYILFIIFIFSHYFMFI